MRILLVGGGSGGHILPTLAVAAVLNQLADKPQLLYVGSMRSADREMVEAVGLEFRAIRSGKLRRYFDWRNVTDLFNIFAGYLQARSIIGRFRPDVVFAKGGYVSLPVLWAAGHMGVRVVAHESDIRVGLANRLAIKQIDKLATTFPVAEIVRSNKSLARHHAKIVQTGLPIDATWDKVVASRPFTNKKPILMITGGSQGASYINQVVAQAARSLIGSVNIVHYTGSGDYASILSFYRSIGREWEGSWIVEGFNVDSFRSYLKGADLVLTRAGSTIFELAYLGKPAVIVPLPGAAGDHQTANANYFVASNAAELILQSQLTADSLVAKVMSLAEDKQRRDVLAKNMKSIGQANLNAAEKIAELIVSEVD